MKDHNLIPVYMYLFLEQNCQDYIINIPASLAAR
jgi:hypothetical protein